MAGDMVVVYAGERRNTTDFGAGCTVVVDAPASHGGKAEAGSPTDLVAVALASCVMTIVAMIAEGHGIDVTGASARVCKEMTTSGPRRIDWINLAISVPAAVPPAVRVAIERGVHSCPVKQSLHPDVDVRIAFEWPG